MNKQHHYNVKIAWTGNYGEGTKTYRSYGRNHVIGKDGAPDIPGSSDPAFRGDPKRYNPEDCLVAALSSCHMLSYLHLCAINNIVVSDYWDRAEGTMQEHADGSGNFIRVVLWPKVTITEGDREKAIELHHKAHELCFIANSVNFPVECAPEIIVATSVSSK